MIRKFIIALLVFAVIIVPGIFGANYYWTHRYDNLIVKTAPVAPLAAYNADPANV